MTEHIDADAVFWDIGGVILALDSVGAAHRDFVETLVREYESPLDPATAVSTWRETVGDHFAAREGTEFRRAREGYRRGVDAILAADADDVEWQDTFRSAVVDRIRPNPDAIAAIERLAGTPVHQGIVSDVDHDEGERMLRTFGLRDHVDAVTTSEAVGRTKPDPAMFETALDAAGVEPDRAVMVGDRYQHDMAGASDLGLVTVAYGAEDGPAVDYRLEDLRDLPPLLGYDVEP